MVNLKNLLLTFVPFTSQRRQWRREMKKQLDFSRIPARSAEMPYTHEQLWELAWKWWEIAKDPSVGANTRHTYKECADQLTDLLGPLTYAATYRGPTTGGLRSGAETVT